MDPFIVNAWADAHGLVLGEVKADEKSNEITAIPRLLRLLDLEGCIVTIDAAGRPPRTHSVERERGGGKCANPDGVLPPACVLRPSRR